MDKPKINLLDFDKHIAVEQLGVDPETNNMTYNLVINDAGKEHIKSVAYKMFEERGMTVNKAAEYVGALAQEDIDIYSKMFKSYVESQRG